MEPGFRSREGRDGVDERTESGKVDNLQTLLRRDFRITGMVSPQGQKDQLSFMSLNRQVEDGLRRGYSEREVIDQLSNVFHPVYLSEITLKLCEK